jgi:hypothetical protein
MIQAITKKSGGAGNHATSEQIELNRQIIEELDAQIAEKNDACPGRGR